MNAQQNRVDGPSIHHAAREEADRHRWIESQKQGRDLGLQAVRDWYRRYWLKFCRHRHLEHLAGDHFWSEFQVENFGDIITLLENEDTLVDRILDRVVYGQENLEIIQWAFDWGMPMHRVLSILSQLNVNAARLEPERV